MESQSTINTLRELLGAILRDADGEESCDVSQIDAQASLVDVGINSIDLMEFALSIENHFSISLLDNADPDEEPATLDDWANLVNRLLPSPPLDVQAQ